MNIPYLRDKSIQCLLKNCLLAIFFVLVTGGGYGCLTILLVPYYQSTQLLNQEILFENELKQIREQSPDQWQQFKRADPSFYFTNVKIKAAFHSLCRLYQVHLKAGNIHEVMTSESLFFKPGSLTITAITDRQIFAFLQHLVTKLSGILVLKVVKLHRNRDLNEQLLAQIKSGQTSGNMVEALIEFEWLILKHDE